MVEQKVYEMARAVEDSVDDELHRLEKMDGDDVGGYSKETLGGDEIDARSAEERAGAWTRGGE